jgi:hypothetical protein
LNSGDNGEIQCSRRWYETLEYSVRYGEAVNGGENG